VETVITMLLKCPLHRDITVSLTDRGRAVLRAMPGRGYTEAALTASGFTTDALADLVRTGLASVTLERLSVRERIIEVVRVKITGAGRQAIRKQR
jgi:hypothetical protein